jgi:MFS family permease
VLRLCLLLAIPMLLAQAFTGSAWSMGLAVALTGASVASMWPLATALLADESSRQDRPAAGVFAASVVAWSSGLAVVTASPTRLSSPSACSPSSPWSPLPEPANRLLIPNLAFLDQLNRKSGSGRREVLFDGGPAKPHSPPPITH